MARTLLLTVVCCLGAVQALADDRPNILWLSCEDISPTIGCYGDPHAKTPHIDALARDGMKFTRTFVAAPVCAVNRSCIITGVYPISLGSHHMRSRIVKPASIRCFSEYLRDAGYYCTNNSKTDYNFVVPKGAWDESSGKAHWRNRPDDDQPFFAVFNFTGTHESFIRGDQPKSKRQLDKLRPDQRVDPAALDIPPYLPDTPRVREDLARNYDNIAALDDWVAAKLEEIDDAGLAGDTIVVFWSDHGIGMTRGKRWLYDSGMHVPMIVRAPQKYADALDGVDPDALVSFVDLAPTMLALAGLDVPEHMQGQVFLGPDRDEPRDYVFGSRDRMDGRYDVMRSARNERWLYIRNIMPWRPYSQYLAYAEQNPNMQEFRRLQAVGELAGSAALFMRETKPLEELYDTEADPHQVNNLADDPEHSRVLEKLRAACFDWSVGCLDLGALPESHIYELEREHGPRYELFRGHLPDDPQPTMVAMWKAGADFGGPPIGLDNDNTAVRFWAAAGYYDDDVSPLLAMAASDESWAVRVAAAERLAHAGRQQEAMAALLNVYANAPHHLDCAMAAGVIDLLPNVDQSADKIRAANKQVEQRLDQEPSQPHVTDYLRRNHARLRQRVAS